MELCIAALCEEQQQAEAGDSVALCKIGLEAGRGQLVERLELLDVAGEGVWVAGADGKEGTLLVCFAGKGEKARGDVWRWGECLEVEEGELCFGEEGVCVGVAHGWGVLELAEDLGEGAFSHCGLDWRLCVVVVVGFLLVVLMGENR